MLTMMMMSEARSWGGKTTTTAAALMMMVMNAFNRVTAGGIQAGDFTIPYAWLHMRYSTRQLLMAA